LQVRREASGLGEDLRVLHGDRRGHRKQSPEVFGVIVGRVLGWVYTFIAPTTFSSTRSGRDSPLCTPNLATPGTRTGPPGVRTQTTRTAWVARSRPR
jgi:hypothetical protein